MKFQKFIFENYLFDKKSKTLSLNYSLDEKVFFTETFVFDFEFTADLETEVLDRALAGLWLTAGVSYFKTYLPPKIVIKNNQISSNQAKFFENLYLHGLGEFFYQNKIKPPKINFPFVETGLETGLAFSGEGSLVALGGGKDSLTTVGILKNKELDFGTFSLGHSDLLQSQSLIIDQPHYQISRKISSQLLDLNKKDALNGHIPISSILGFVGVISAVLLGKKNVIFSNENSANEPTIVGTNINHQFSKTLEFEKSLQQYVHENISDNLNYFSFLRPWSELKIAQVFCSNFFKDYKKSFSSCNRNFKLGNKNKKFNWCGECPKCAFVFTIFAPFLGADELTGLFNGQNLFLKDELRQTFLDLAGVGDRKPFECVGTVNEVRESFYLATEKGFLGAKEFTVFFERPEFDIEEVCESSMPEEFEEAIAREK